MANPKAAETVMPPLSSAENACRDAQAALELDAGVGMRSEEVFDWLSDRIDGAAIQAPKARKL